MSSIGSTTRRLSLAKLSRLYRTVEDDSEPCRTSAKSDRRKSHSCMLNRVNENITFNLATKQDSDSSSEQKIVMKSNLNKNKSYETESSVSQESNRTPSIEDSRNLGPWSEVDYAGKPTQIVANKPLIKKIFCNSNGENTPGKDCL